MSPKKRARGAGYGEVVAQPVNVFTDLVQTLAKPSSAHDSTQRDQLHQMAVFLSEYLRSECKSMVQQAGSRPMMVYYSCDGTPIRTQVRHTAHVGDLTIRRSGKKTTEFLAQV